MELSPKFLHHIIDILASYIPISEVLVIPDESHDLGRIEKPEVFDTGVLEFLSIWINKLVSKAGLQSLVLLRHGVFFLLNYILFIGMILVLIVVPRKSELQVNSDTEENIIKAMSTSSFRTIL